MLKYSVDGIAVMVMDSTEDIVVILSNELWHRETS